MNLAKPSPTNFSSFVIGLLLLALIIRWSYCFALFVFMGDAGLMGVDSHSYIDAGRYFARSFLSFHDFELLGSNTNIMPLATWLLALAALLADDHMPLIYVLMQCLFDTGTCLLIYLAAKSIDSRIGLPALAFSAINPTQIVLCGLVYVDVVFVLFVAIFLFGALSWLRTPSWTSTILIIVGACCAALTRVLITPFVFALPFLLLFLGSFTHRLEKRNWVQLSAIPLIFALCLAPIYFRNGISYGSWSLTSQSGLHLARWIVPLVWETNDGTPWERGYQEMERRAAAAGLKPGQNPFDQSTRYRNLAIEELKRLGLFAVTKAWTVGAIINLATPGILLSPPVSQLPRTGFYATPGRSPTEKITNFLFRSDNRTYSWIMLVSVFGTVTVRLAQAIGFLSLGRDRTLWPALCLLAAWIAFILAINGPIASPKYRLPLEIPLCILFGAGSCAVMGRRTRGLTEMDQASRPRCQPRP